MVLDRMRRREEETEDSLKMAESFYRNLVEHQLRFCITLVHRHPAVSGPVVPRLQSQ